MGFVTSVLELVNVGEKLPAIAYLYRYGRNYGGFVVFVSEHFVLSINVGCVHKLYCRVPSPSV